MERKRVKHVCPGWMEQITDGWDGHRGSRTMMDCVACARYGEDILFLMVVGLVASGGDGRACRYAVS